MLNLRPYQKEAVECALAYLEEGESFPLLWLATGTGKTLIAAEIAHRFGEGTVFIAHRQELLRQFAQIAPAVPAFSIQGLYRNPIPWRPKLVILDEAHHFAVVNKTYVKLLDYSCPIVGLTATPLRADGLLFPFRLVYKYDLLKAILDGFLVPIVFRRGPLDLTKAIERVAQYLPTMVFVPRVSIAKDFAMRMRSLGLRAIAVHGGMRPEEREEARVAFEAAEYDVVTNAIIWTEGMNFPNVRSVIMFSCTQTALGYEQRLGRALRPAPGKRECFVLDCFTLLRPFYTLPMLFGLPSLSYDEHGFQGRIPEDVLAWKEHLQRCPEAQAIVERYGYFPFPFHPLNGH